jgi:hypothetical protein
MKADAPSTLPFDIPVWVPVPVARRVNALHAELVELAHDIVQSFSNPDPAIHQYVDIESTLAEINGGGCPAFC